ncbi:hypothetical protein [Catenibacterium mitsuokai]|uniref:hypothetical protein n=1 Tax=Catenibacterium mitsuokai TaxID=100886 RepID=UPI00319E33C0
MSNFNFIKAFKAIQENKDHEIELSSNEITELKSINESFIELLGNAFYYGYHQGNNAQELETGKKINMIWAIDSAKETITSRYDINFIALLQIVKLCDSDNEAMKSLFILGYNQGVKAYRNSKR